MYSCEEISNVDANTRFGIEIGSFICLDKNEATTNGIIACAINYCIFVNNTGTTQYSCKQINANIAGLIGREKSTQLCLDQNVYT